MPLTSHYRSKEGEGVMENHEILKDWLFRYRFVYRSRLRDKSKQRFLKALIADISTKRTDIQVIAFDHTQKCASRNVYIGDITKADKIICTYYDTPPQHFGGYTFFDQKKQGQKTAGFIAFTSFLMILVGIIATWIYTLFAERDFTLFSLNTIFFMILFGLYFVLLGRIAKGDIFQKTLTRNTSSVIAILMMIHAKQEPNTAFAFLDEGSYGDRGLKVLLEHIKPNSEICYLDCIGADAPIHVMGSDSHDKQLSQRSIPSHSLGKKGSMNLIFSAETDQNNTFFLSKKKLHQKNIHMENLYKVAQMMNLSILKSKEELN